MSADLLRRAADHLRLVAGHASASPWTVADDGLVWPERMGDPVSGSSSLDDAEYIATMQPAVAWALASLFNDEALSYEQDGCPWSDDAPVFVLARTILREVRS